jgi:hypothetical protein
MAKSKVMHRIRGDPGLGSVVEELMDKVLWVERAS